MSANIYTHQNINIWKTWILMALFFVIVIILGWFLSIFYGNTSILYIAVLLAVFMNVFSYWFSDKIVLKIHKAKSVNRAEYFDLWNITENLSITAGLPMPRLYIIEDQAPNAFATGRDKKHAIVCVALLSDFFLRSQIWGTNRNRDNSGSGVLLIIGLVLAILTPITATLIRLAISRKREFLADASGALLTRYPEGLANALRKISAA